MQQVRELRMIGASIIGTHVMVVLVESGRKMAFDIDVAHHISVSSHMMSHVASCGSSAPRLIGFTKLG